MWYIYNIIKISLTYNFVVIYFSIFLIKWILSKVVKLPKQYFFVIKMMVTTVCMVNCVCVNNRKKYVGYVVVP